MTTPKERSFNSPPENAKPIDLGRALFPLEHLQSLDAENALRCQAILGHGKKYGIWETPDEMVPHMRNHVRQIDLRRRIAAYLPKDTPTSPILNELLDEGVLWLTQLAVLLRMGPAGLAGTAKFKSLDASTITTILYQHLSRLVAMGLISRLGHQYNSYTGFASALTADDLRSCSENEGLRIALKRLSQLHGLGLWSDVPPVLEFKNKTTPVRGEPIPHTSEQKSTPYSPIPDDYLATMGPRVLWIIKDLGPNLIHLLEALLVMLDSDFVNRRDSKKVDSDAINRRISRYFETNVWQDRHGQAIVTPPFELRHGSTRGRHMLNDPSQNDPYVWPPKHWASVQALAVALQSSHLWITLLVMAARIGEVATLGRHCVEFARDGKPYANGKTYKASRALVGKDREWPIPEILLDVLAQQVKLVEVCERLEKKIQDASEMSALMGGGNHLWASLGTSGIADPTQKLVMFGQSLQMLAERIGLSPKPSGKNLHPHRFRKTLARLAGLAIDGSQKVLMLLLGHEDVTTTLGYMQSDPAFAKEVDDITRELRIMRGESLIEDMRAALRDPNSLPYGGHGGGGAPVLAESVRTYEEELHRTGQEWGAETARELAVLLTNNGESARLISAHVVCTKTAGEIGLCSQKKGAIIAGNCQTECRNHIEEKTGRRDTERVIPILVQHAQESIANNDWLPLLHEKKQLEQELKRYDDIRAKWTAQPEVQAILRAST